MVSARAIRSRQNLLYEFQLDGRHFFNQTISRSILSLWYISFVTSHWQLEKRDKNTHTKYTARWVNRNGRNSSLMELKCMTFWLVKWDAVLIKLHFNVLQKEIIWAMMIALPYRIAIIPFSNGKLVTKVGMRFNEKKQRVKYVIDPLQMEVFMRRLNQNSYQWVRINWEMKKKQEGMEFVGGILERVLFLFMFCVVVMVKRSIEEYVQKTFGT